MLKYSNYKRQTESIKMTFEETITTLITAAVKDVLLSAEEQTGGNGNFTSLVFSTQQTVANLGCRLIERICSEVDARYNKSRNSHKVYKVHSSKKRTMVTEMGDLVLNRALYKEKESGRYFFAVDELLHIEPSARIEQGLKAKIIQRAALKSYAFAVSELKGRVSRQTAHKLVKNMTTFDLKPPQTFSPVTELYIEADEDHIHLQNGKPAEARLVYVHEGVKHLCTGRNKLKNVHYFSSVTSSKDALWEEVSSYVYDKYSPTAKITLSGDGASWIKSGSEYFFKPTYNLDKFHVQKALTTLTQGDAKLRSDLNAYLKTSPQEFETEFNRLRKEQNLKLCQDAAGAYIYLKDNADFINPSGRCSAEGHVSHILSDRMSSRPMGWSRAGADRIARLRAFSFNGGDFLELLKTQEKHDKRKGKKTPSTKKGYNCSLHAEGIAGTFAAAAASLHGAGSRNSSESLALRKLLR
jgi:hypothetical protein